MEGYHNKHLMVSSTRRHIQN